MRLSSKVLSWAAPLLVLGVVALAMFVISNVTGLHLSVDKKTLSGAHLDGTFELFSTVRRVELPQGDPGVDAGTVRRFFQIGQSLSCRCVLKFVPSCDSGPCGGQLSIWRQGKWSREVPFTYIGDGSYRWKAPPDSCGCYGGKGLPATIASEARVKVATTNQVGGQPEVFEFQGMQSSEWRLGSNVKGFPEEWKVIAAVDAAATNF